MRSLTKTGIRILSAKYRSILIKCAIINASVFIGAFGVGSAMADSLYANNWTDYKNAINNGVQGHSNIDKIYVRAFQAPGLTYEGTTNNIDRTLSIDGLNKFLSGNDTYQGLTVDTDGILTLENITMKNFTKATSDMMGQANGGAVNNKGTITDITGNFNSNFITSSGQMSNARGGAIYNNGIIGGIKGDFDSNFANTGFLAAYAYGGAIYNGTAGTIESIEGDFTSNHSHDNGGAIYNSGTIGNIEGDFTSNYASVGGAIYNSWTIENIEGDFIANYATTGIGGGGIFNIGGNIKSITGNFIGNYTTNNYGGAIYNSGTGATLNIVANNDELKFDGNYLKSSFVNGGAIYNTGTVGLYAINDTDKITFTGSDKNIPDADKASAKAIDDIYNAATLNINGDGNGTTYAGIVNLYSVSDAATAKGTTTIYGGTVNVAKDIIQKNIDVKSGATLSSTTDGASIVANATFTNAGTVNMSGDRSKLAAKNLTNNGTIDVVNVVADTLLINNGTINAMGMEVAALENNGDVNVSGIIGAIQNNEGGTITFNNTDKMLINLTNSGTVNFNGYLNYPNSDIILTQNAGVINFSTNAVTEGCSINSFTMNGGLVNIANGNTDTLYINQLKLDGTTNLMIDADLESAFMDTISVTEINGSGTLNISDIKLLSDANDDYVELSLFADDATKGLLADKVSGNLNGLKYSTTYKYDALYDSATGMIGFTRYNSGTSDDFNPYLYTPSGVANTTAAMTTQIATLVMDKMDDVVHAQGRSGGDTPSSSNVWVKVMGSNDNVEFKNFENIDSKAMTVTAGYNTNKITCGDYDIVLGAYAGYIGGKQQYTANDIDQDGGYIGLSSALTLGDAFLTATVNGGLLKNKANNMYGTDRFNTLWLGTGLKAGYNYAITDSVVLQPNVYGGYTLVNTKDYTSVSGVKIATNNLNFFEIDPGLKLSAVIADGWTGSVQGKYAIVMDNGADITANDIALQNISTKNYFEYGIGIDKSLTDAFYLGAKINRHDGGRTGWNGSIEFRYKF